MIGSLDNDPNAPGLRHTEEAELQGANRLERAISFINTVKNYLKMKGLIILGVLKSLMVLVMTTSLAPWLQIGCIRVFIQVVFILFVLK